jgi:hypothetical protein
MTTDTAERHTIDTDTLRDWRGRLAQIAEDAWLTADGADTWLYPRLLQMARNATALRDELDKELRREG